MNLVARSQLRFLQRSGLSVISALIGMTLGVASIVGVHLLSERIEQQIAANAQPLGAVDLYLTRGNLQERDYFELRKRWRAGELPAIETLFPIVDGRVRYGDASYQLVGADPIALPGVLNAATTQPRGDQESTANRQSEGYLIRDSLFVPQDLLDAHAKTKNAGTEQVRTIQLNGLTLEVLGISTARSILLADLPTAQRVLGFEGRLSRIAVRLREPLNQGVGVRLRGWAMALFPGVLAAAVAPRLTQLDSSWQQLPSAEVTPALRLTRSILFNIAALSLLSLVVAWLLTYQVAQHAIERRQAMFARLHSLGVTNRRLQRIALFEGCVAGLISVVAGLLLGRALANGLFLVTLGSAPEPSLPLHGWVVGKALVTGLGVGVVSYALALKFAQAQEPALSRASASVSIVRRWHKVAACVLLLGFAWGALYSNSGLAGAFCTIVVSALVAIIYLPLFTSWLWRLTLTTRRLWQAPLKVLPWRQLLVGRDLRLGISALTLAIATALGISVMVESFRSAFVDLLDSRLVDDVALDIAAAGGLKVLDASVAGTQARLLLRGNQPVQCVGVRGTVEYASDDAELAKRFGAPDGLAPGELLISESFAYFNSIRPGATVTLQGALGTRKFRVKNTFADFGETEPRIVMALADAASVVATDRYQQALISSPAANSLREKLNAASIEFSVPAETKEQALEVFEQTFGITRALTMLALIVAIVAMANALGAQGLALAPTENLLRVLGIADGAARLLRVSRAGLAGLLAVGLALPLGLLMAWLLCNLVNPRAYGWQFPLLITPRALLWPLVGGLVAAGISALVVWTPSTPDPVGSPR